jgi:hypothetical protein
VGALVRERWLPVPGHDGYEVSDRGRLRSYRDRQGHPRETPRLLSPGLVSGYRHIKLGRSFQCGVHLLVLRAFVGPAPDGMECRHLDGDRQNNVLANLRWGTKAENYDDRRGHGTANDGERHGKAKLTEAAVRLIRASDGDLGALATQFGVSKSAVAHVWYQRSWRHVA